MDEDRPTPEEMEAERRYYASAVVIDGLSYFPETLMEVEADETINCEKCDEIIPVGATIYVATWYEGRGEFWGAPCSEQMGSTVCDSCAQKAKESVT